MIERKKALLIVSGEGGHTVQMERLLSHLDFQKNNLTFSIILLTDTKRIKSEFNNSFDQVYYVPQLRNKVSKLNSKLMFPVVFMRNIVTVLSIYYKWQITVVLSTGPGVAILPFLFAKLFRVQSIFIEDWSKFTSLTITGRIVKYFVTYFLVQNKELLPFVSKGRYVGRL